MRVQCEYISLLYVTGKMITKEERKKKEKEIHELEKENRSKLFLLYSLFYVCHS